MTRPARKIFRFQIRLRYIEPPIWRLLELAAESSFWDLHVAIQDAMGWLDYHLHEFTPGEEPRPGDLRIGIPDDEAPEVLPGWTTPVRALFRRPGDRMLYTYDFGDNWQHDVTLVAIDARSKGTRYPRCSGGERACPPEDCGGISGYEELLVTLANPRHEEYQANVNWLKGHAKSYWPYDPGAFNPMAVKISNAKRRLARMLA